MKPPTPPNGPARPPNPITHLRANSNTRPSVATYSAATQHNARKTPWGQAIDKKLRSQLSAGTGRDACHVHSLSGGFDAGDSHNLYLGNSLQNRAGGAKAHTERIRDRAIEKDPNLRIRETSRLLHQPGRAGYGSKIPIGESVKHEYIENGEVVHTSSHILANTSTAASRYADRQKAAGKPVVAAETARLNREQRAVGRQQGHGTTKQAQAATLALRERAKKGEQVGFGPKLATNGGVTVPRAGAAAPIGKQAAARKMAQAAAQVKTPPTPARGPQKSR